MSIERYEAERIAGNLAEAAARRAAEDLRADLAADLRELRNQIKWLEAENGNLKSELADLRAQVLA